MKKIFIIVLLTLVIGLTGCSNQNSGNINPNKVWSQSTGYDFIAFGVQHFYETDQFDVLNLTDVELNQLAYPLNNNNIVLLTARDVENMRILSDAQLTELNDYCDAVNCENIKISFIRIDNQDVIRITNLNVIKDSLLDKGYSYNLDFDSTVLDFDDIVYAACNALQVDTINSLVLNTTSTGIFLRGYENENNVSTLNFYVLNADTDGTYINAYNGFATFDLEIS